MQVFVLSLNQSFIRIVKFSILLRYQKMIGDIGSLKQYLVETLTFLEDKSMT